MPFDRNKLEIGRLYSRADLATQWDYASHHAIAKGGFTPAGQRTIILFVTREKQSSLTQYVDLLNGDQLHWEGEERHRNDSRIARAHEAGEEIHLFYRDIHHTPFRYHGEVRLRRFTQRTSKPREFRFELLHDLSADDDVKNCEAQLAVLKATEREAVVRARVGQGQFRQQLFDIWAGCAVTGVPRPELLRASHIKPWRFASNKERLDPFNGLLLLPQYDLLFDRGCITFDSAGVMEPSSAIASVPAVRIGIEKRACVRKVEPAHLAFLEYHRQEVFLRRLARE